MLERCVKNLPTRDDLDMVGFANGLVDTIILSGVLSRKCFQERLRAINIQHDVGRLSANAMYITYV